MTTRAPITPDVICWARETAKLSVAEAAAAIGRPESDIIAWEDGSLQPTMPQARKAAHVYKRPLAVFYLPAPPKGWQVLRDFRTLPMDEPREYSAELSYLMREAVSRQEWLREFLIEDGSDPLKFIGSATTSTNVLSLAQAIRSQLGITTEACCTCRSRDEALGLWMAKAEEAGVFLFREGSVGCVEARGFVLADEYAPFIFLNSSDAKVAQIFTLAHELVHLWINEPGVSNLETRGSSPDKSAESIEVFCNAVAGYLVLDQAAFEQSYKLRDRSRAIKEHIESLSSHFKVSREVVARRLLEMGELTQKTYAALRRQYHEEWLEFREQERLRQKSRETGPSYYRVLVSKNGKAYTRTVLSAYYSGAVSGRTTSELLNVKINNLPKLAEEAGSFVGAYKGESR